MTRAIALLLLTFCSFGFGQSAADWRFAQPDADMKMSMNFQALLKSDAIAKAIEQGKAQAKDNVVQIEMAVAMARMVDRISISAQQKGASDMDVLAEVTGSFDPQLIAGMFPSTGKAHVKVVAPHTILIGEGDSFDQAVARMSGSAAPGSGDDLEPSDIWIQVSGAMLAKQSGQEGSPMLKGVHGLSVGLTLGEAPVINMALTTADAATAGSLFGILQAATPMLAGSPSTAALAKTMSLTQDGSRVRMHLVLPPEVLAMLQQQAASSATAAGKGGGGIPAQLAPLLGSFGIGGGAASSTKPPPAQNDGKIKIYGLEDGPKELPGPK